MVRFEAERQALALLDHPNVAHVYDAGTTERGRPYFVMEYVQGAPITQYCDSVKLTIEERLKLFIQVCEAIQNAHQKGIIHRDIKPSNILVSTQDNKPIPKVIDFGVAKALGQALTERTMFTEQGQLVGTPGYMSPEQADLAGQDIDTRTDVYSLGVVLYELLAGTLPFDAKRLREAAFEEIQRIIREEEPPRPSTRLSSVGDEAASIAQGRATQVVTLIRCLHRELEWIPLKAIRKERDRRYQSAADLGKDVQNYLNDNPLLAGPESKVYRVKKFVKKRRRLVASIASIAAVLVLGTIVSTAMYLQAKGLLTKTQEIVRVSQKQEEFNRRQHYFQQIVMADSKLWDGDVSRAKDLLGSCPKDLRSWEWYDLRRISDTSVLTFQGAWPAAIGPEGKCVALRDGNDIDIRDIESGDVVRTLCGHQERVISLAFSPHGKYIASASDGTITIKVWEVESGAEVRTLWGPQGRVVSLAFSPDGKRIASACGKMIKIRDTESGRNVMTFGGHEDWVTFVAFSPDGRRLASGCRDRTIKIWDTESGSYVLTLSGHEGGVYCVAFSPDGKQLASASADKTIIVWDVQTRNKIRVVEGHSDYVLWVAYSPDNRILLSGSQDNSIKFWDAQTGQEIAKIDISAEETGPMCLSSDGKRIVSGGSYLCIREANGGSAVLTLAGNQVDISCLAVRTDGGQIATGSSDGTITVWQAASQGEVAAWEKANTEKEELSNDKVTKQ